MTGCTADHMAELLIIDITHIRKTNSKLVNIWSDQWGRDKAGDLIPDQHKISGVKVFVNPSGGIGQKKNLCTH